MSFGFSKGIKATPANIVTNEQLADLRKDSIVASHAKRLALELECLLLSCDVSSTWWHSANEVLSQYQEDIDRLYPQDHVSPLGTE